MKKIVVVKTFVQDLLLLIDKGESVDLDRIREEVYNGTLVQFLKDFSKEYFKKYDMPLHYFKEEESSYINSVFNDYVYGYDRREDRKLGISNNGLVLLALYGVELVRELGKNEEIK
ncbi:hypothetical protein HLK66_04775 [Niallia circulans]|uniref:hypothetical protein n=1 Tax=Niallia circulans TaxID=1397 RepID=UPI00148FA0E1|nr:hypothetical protein [Niallia circulans]QJX61027.1 hypothetical protein HLK66_04775 [Niallia circulans]